MKQHFCNTILLIFFSCFTLVLPSRCLSDQTIGTRYPLTLTDSAGQQFVFKQKPRKVVCMAPYITEMIVSFGQSDAMIGLTRQDLLLNAGLRTKNVGSVFAPDIAVIAACSPDLVIATPYQQKGISQLKTACPIMIMETATLNQSFSQMMEMGRLFDCEDAAQTIVSRIKEQLSLVAQRLERKKNLKKKRVVRVMAGESLSCPGDDSFQNEMIKAAGGVVPIWGKNGFAVPVDAKALNRFNPEFIFGCHDNKEKVMETLKRPEYKEIDAVKSGAVSMFPCQMTCQASTQIGNFVAWLAAVLYPELFADPEKAVTPDALISKRSVGCNLDYIGTASIVTHRLADSEYKSLVIRFKEPLDVLSTLQGVREKVDGCGNTFVPMAASLGHMRNGPDQVLTTLEKNLGFDTGKFATLMTGADMDHLAVSQKNFKDLSVTAFATAGVKGNAMRMSKDKGYYFSHGTINIIVGANRELSKQAMARSVITVTEAKTAALTDLDIRSSYTPWQNRATGTGTDNVMVIQGKGRFVQFAGGHSKLAELMAKAVHEAVTEAVSKQNGIRLDRDIFQRLSDRRLSLESIVDRFEFQMEKRALISQIEALLSDPWYAEFISSAMALSDARGQGLIRTDGFWDDTCADVAVRICGQAVTPAIYKANSPRANDKENANNRDNNKDIPLTLRKAIGTLISAIENRIN